MFKGLFQAHHICKLESEREFYFQLISLYLVSRGISSLILTLLWIPIGVEFLALYLFGQFLIMVSLSIHFECVPLFSHYSLNQSGINLES